MSRVNKNMPTMSLLLPVIDASGRPSAERAFFNLIAMPGISIPRDRDEAGPLADSKALRRLRARRWRTLT